MELVIVHNVVGIHAVLDRVEGIEWSGMYAVLSTVLA